MEFNDKESHAMSKLTTTQSTEAPSSEETALMTRLGLLLGDHRVSTVKTQSHIHPVLSHQNSNNCFSTASAERRKKHCNTTSPASTLSDKGIGSSVGSFDSELRQNLSTLAETNASSNRTGSLDSRSNDLANHSRTDSGIPSHSRSSSDIVSTEKRDVTRPRLAEQYEEKLWTIDPRRNSGNTQTLPGPEIRSKVPPVPKARRGSERSTDTVLAADVMKLPQLCTDSPNNPTHLSLHSSVSSSRSLTPSASVCDFPNYKAMNRSTSCQSNSTAVPDHEALPPPPPPPPSQNYYEDYDDLPPPPPPPPMENSSNHSRASSTDRGLSNEDVIRHRQQSSYHREENNNFLPQERVMGKPPINRTPQHTSYNNPLLPPPAAINRAAPHPYEQAAPNMIQMLRASSGLTRSSPSPKDDYRMMSHGRQWPSDQEISRNLASSMSSVSISHSRQSSANSSYAGSGIGYGLWEESRPHSLSAPPPNPMIQNLMHKTSASFDNSGFHRRGGDRASNRSYERQQPLSNASSASDVMRMGRVVPYRLSDVNLHSITFDLPWAVISEAKFVGREWVFGEIASGLTVANSNIYAGAILYGAEGTGKTSIISQLESNSYQGLKKLGQPGSNATLSKPDFGSSIRSGSPRLQHRHIINHSNNSSRTGSPSFGMASTKANSRSNSQTSLSGEDALKKLASQVVAYHYCQADNNRTCYVPEFLHSIVAQLTQAPQLTHYREFLLDQPRLLNLLSLRSCIQNPTQAMREAVLQPLIALRNGHKLPRINYVILVDGLGEAEQHRPDHGDSIASFLQRHLPEFPPFLKVIATCRTRDKEAVGKLPLMEISLDYGQSNENVERDVQAYITSRISSSKVLSNMTLMGKPDVATTQKLLTSHLQSKCDGNILYLRLILDLIENGKLSPKSAGFKVVPVNISEAFLLMCNLKFTSSSSFARVKDILAVVLASLYPLKDDHIYQALVAGSTGSDEVTHEDFQYLMEMISQFLVIRPSDNCRSFFHPTFRDWLSSGHHEDNQTPTNSSTKKFSVDPKRGHALLAKLMSRQPRDRITPHAAIEMAHHLLKAKMYRNHSKATGINSLDLHADFMAQSCSCLSESLTTVRNLFYPNIGVSKLLLHSGANPNIRSQVLCEAPAICAAAHIGSEDFVRILLTYGADVNLPANNGMTCLAYAAAAGHINIVKFLLQCNPRFDAADRNGHSALLHAISRDHVNIAIILLTCDLYISPEQRKFFAQQAFVAAATTGCIKLLQYLMDHPDYALRCDPDSMDPTRGESALTAAASRGKEATCEYLIRQRNANIELRNKFGMTPLLCAVKQGQWETVSLLINLGAATEGADAAHRTPLITAATLGHVGVLQLLLSNGASVHSVDKEGFTALSWASLKGHLHCVRCLIDNGSDVGHRDKHGRTPIDLATYSGNEQIIDLLLSVGAEFTRSDMNNMSPVERAIVNQNTNTLARILRSGATISDAAWGRAMSSADILATLLEKCVEEANVLYKEGKIREASVVYSNALYQLKEPVTNQQLANEHVLRHEFVRELTALLLLGLAKCSRKVDDIDTAEIACTRALMLKPHWYEALFVRARVRKEASRLTAALQDIEEAQAYAPPQSAKEISRLLEKIREESNKCGNRNSISESSECGIRVPGQRHNSFSGSLRRPRLNSASSYNYNNNSNSGSRSSSPAPLDQAMSRSYQPQGPMNEFEASQPPKYHNRFPYLGREGHEFGDLRRNHSQELVSDNQARMFQHRQQRSVPYQHRVMSGVPQTNNEFVTHNSSGLPPVPYPYNHATMSNAANTPQLNEPQVRAGLKSSPTPKRRTVATEL